MWAVLRTAGTTGCHWACRVIHGMVQVASIGKKGGCLDICWGAGMGLSYGVPDKSVNGRGFLLHSSSCVQILYIVSSVTC